MKSVRDRAIDIVWDVYGKNFSRAVIATMAADDSEGGKSTKNLLAAIERGIEADRREHRASVAPS